MFLETKGLARGLCLFDVRSMLAREREREVVQLQFFHAMIILYNLIFLALPPCQPGGRWLSSSARRSHAPDL
jgi:hypothetical protein